MRNVPHAHTLARLVKLTAPSTCAYGDPSMQCFVYASLRKAESFLWLSVRDDFSVMPEPLALMLGDLKFVLEVQLDPHRKLPREDIELVLENLRDRGWHLQLPSNQTLAIANHPEFRRAPHDDREE